MNRRLLLIYTIVLLDVVAGSAIGPVLPQFVKNFAQPQLWLSVATGVFLGVQLFSAPLLGKLSDSVGRRPLLLTSTVGTLLANLLLTPVRAGFLFANRVSDGLTNGMYALMRSSVTDISPKDELVKNIGLVSTIISLGNVFGPMASSIALTLTRNPDQQTQIVVWVAIGIAALNVGFSFFFQETTESRADFDAGEVRTEVVHNLNVRNLWARLQEKDEQTPGLKSLTLLTLLLTLNQGYLNYFIPYVGLGQLKLNATQTAYFFVFFGGISALANYVYFKYLVDRIDKRKLLTGAALVGVGLHLVYANIGHSQTLLYVAAAADAVSVSLIGGLLNGLVAQLTSDEDRGEIFGVTQALSGIASLVTTLVYGGLSVIDLRLPFYWFALCMAALALLSFRLKKQPDNQSVVA